MGHLPYCNPKIEPLLSCIISADYETHCLLSRPRLSFEAVDERTHVRMVDVRGAVVFESVLPAGSSAIDLSQCADGWYVLHLVGLQSHAVQRAPFLIRR